MTRAIDVLRSCSAFLILSIAITVCKAVSDDGFHWEGIQQFEKFGYDVLPCPKYQRSQCCVCKSIVRRLEKLIGNPDASRDYEVDAYGFRMNARRTQSGAKKAKRKRVPYVESMAGIAEALENVCYSNLSMSIPKIETRVQEATDIYFSTCDEFTKDFEEFVQKRFFDYSTKKEKHINFVHEICVRDTKLCDGLDNAFSNAPHWHVTVGELNLISKDLEDAYKILNDMIVLRNDSLETTTSSFNDKPSKSLRSIEYNLLMNKFFFKIGHAAALSRSQNQQLWHSLFTQHIAKQEYEIAKIKLMNKIHAANSFHDEDLFDEEY